MPVDECAAGTMSKGRRVYEHALADSAASRLDSSAEANESRDATGRAKLSFACPWSFTKPGCSIPVVRTLREGVDWVRFPAARKTVIEVRLR